MKKIIKEMDTIRRPFFPSLLEASLRYDLQSLRSSMFQKNIYLILGSGRLNSGNEMLSRIKRLIPPLNDFTLFLLGKWKPSLKPRWMKLYPAFYNDPCGKKFKIMLYPIHFRMENILYLNVFDAKYHLKVLENDLFQDQK